VEARKIISRDPEVLGGTPVFAGTRGPIESMFDNFQAGLSLDGFLKDFPTVSREQAVSLLEISNRFMNTIDLEKLYETAV